jgi:hypothetical protein
MQEKKNISLLISVDIDLIKGHLIKIKFNLYKGRRSNVSIYKKVDRM